MKQNVPWQVNTQLQGEKKILARKKRPSTEELLTQQTFSIMAVASSQIELSEEVEYQCRPACQ